MKNIHKLLCCALALFLLLPVYAIASDVEYAKNITDKVNIKTEGFSSTSRLTDGAENKGAVTDSGTVQIVSDEIIGSIYVVFNSDVNEWSLKCKHGNTVFGANGFLHEYVEIEKSIGEVKEITLEFENETEISEIYVFSSGQKPEWVQMWKKPAEKADILLLVAHSDDDQLFFAGLIPYYSAKGYAVQVSYLTYHNDTMRRRHELLNGLWTAGTEYYPFYEKFDDFLIEDLDKTISEYKRRGTEYEELESYVVECIRRCKPQVVVSHDPDGEYGHGMHMLLSKLVQDSVNICGDESKYPDSAKKYGIWTQKKTYLHLYDKNILTLDIDTPMDELNGDTPFQISQKAFKKHVSQDFTWFYPWIYGNESTPITSSAQIKKYSPRYYGLYDTKVGYDTGKNDLLENVFTYKQQREFENNINSAQGFIAQTQEKLAGIDSKLDEYKKIKTSYIDLQIKFENVKTQGYELEQQLAEIRNNRDVISAEYSNGSDTVALIFLGIYILCVTVIIVWIASSLITKNREKARYSHKT